MNRGDINIFTLTFSLIFIILACSISDLPAKTIIIDNSIGFYIDESSLGFQPQPGDTILIDQSRTQSIKFKFINGSENNPIVVTNHGGQVLINDLTKWGALTFENCNYIKLSGQGSDDYKYGFSLAANQCGLAFTELSSHCETEFIHIDHEGFFGIYAKKDYGGTPPTPTPQFQGLSIHDCFIENVTEGMYLGETKTPGMEFSDVSIYNNIVINTGREAIQIANMVNNVEVYNNTMINMGLDGEYAQNNGLQIGDNSVVYAYNNIIKNAPGFGIISFGLGNTKYENNYIESTQGIFIDNRKVSDSTLPIEIMNNVFYLNNGPYLVKTFNEINNHIIDGNTYNTQALDVTNKTQTISKQIGENKYDPAIDSCRFVNIKNKNYSIDIDLVPQYYKIGAPGGDFTINNTSSNSKAVQLSLTPDMLIDQVLHGSYNSPLFLIDEQNIDQDTDEHPTSNSWKPHWNMENGPYHVVIDLGTAYKLDKILLHDMHGVAPLKVSISIDNIEWSDIFDESCDGFKSWKIHTIKQTAQFIRFSMHSSVYAAVNEIKIYGESIDKQISLLDARVIDQVDGESYYSPNFLFDEQNKTPESEMHPESNSWKPHWNLDKAPYFAVLELDAEYDISKIALHDMHSTGLFTIEYGTPDNWTMLIEDGCNSYNTWNTHKTNITTQYLRFSMPISVYSGINEVILYGNKNENNTPFKSQNIVESKTTGIDFTTNYISNSNIIIYPSIVSTKLNMKYNQNNIGSCEIRIFTLSGKEVYNNTFNVNYNNENAIDLSHLHNGSYILNYTDCAGTQENHRFKKISK